MSNSSKDNRDYRQGASPPCFMHELDNTCGGPAHDIDPQQRKDVMRWRKAERQRLRAARKGLDKGLKTRFAEQISARLDSLLGDVSSTTISLYWPIHDEPDLRKLMASIVARGGTCSLPVVVEPGAPLVFRRWQPNTTMQKGIWGIPVPAAADAVMPDIIIAPIVGFDPQCYRLGYGGGYFDRTLALLGDKEVLTIGIGYAQSSVPTIFPQTHDIPLHRIVTEEAVISGNRDTGS